MDDAVHVDVEVVVDARFLLGGGDDPWVFGHQPPVERRYPHGRQLQRARGADRGELRCEEAEGMRSTGVPISQSPHSNSSGSTSSFSLPTQ